MTERERERVEEVNVQNKLVNTCMEVSIYVKEIKQHHGDNVRGTVISAHTVIETVTCLRCRRGDERLNLASCDRNETLQSVISTVYRNELYISTGNEAAICFCFF